MPLPLHLLIHFGLALLTGYLAGRYFKKLEMGIVAGFIGGFLIDFDHVLEYLITFGPQFSLQYFLEGRQFLITDQIHLWFHAWEYIIVLIILARIFRTKQILAAFLITLAFASGIHLLTDSIINNYPLKYYSLSYRQELGFSAQKLLSPAEYQKNQKIKKELGI